MPGGKRVKISSKEGNRMAEKRPGLRKSGRPYWMKRLIAY